MHKQNILVVDDEPDIRALVKEILMDEGFSVYVASDTTEARKKFTQYSPDLVLLDIWMSNEDGISLLKDWNNDEEMNCPVIVMSGHGTVDTAVEATRLGAKIFIEKPLTESKLLQSIHSVLDTRIDSQGELISVIRPPVGSSTLIQNLRKRAQSLAEGTRNIIIYGEKGTGKLSLAEYIHSLSNQSDKPLLDWAEIPRDDALIQSNRTLLVSRMSLLPEQETKLINLCRDASDLFQRIIIMQHEVPNVGKNTEDALLALLRPTAIYAPALHEHTEDVPEIISACVDYHSLRYRLLYRKFSIAALNYLLHEEWPDNLYGVNKLVRSLLETGDGEEITLDETKNILLEQDVLEGELNKLLNQPLREARENFERIYLIHHLRDVDGSISRLASKADMERTHLYRKLQALGVNYKQIKKR